MPELHELRPSFSSSVAQRVADVAGGVVYGGEVEGEIDVAFGGPTSDFIEFGVVNGSFAQGPPAPAEYLDPQNNPMPYWFGPTIVTGGASNVAWAADADSPSGYNLRFILGEGAVERVYMQQVVPIAGSRTRQTGHVLRATFIPVVRPGSAATAYVFAQYLDVTGATVGAETSSTATLNDTLGTGVLVSTMVNATGGSSAPSNAALCRIRIEVRSDGNPYTVDVSDVRLDRAYMTLMAAEQNAPASYAPGVIQQYDGQLYLDSDGSTRGGGIAVNRGTYVRVYPQLVADAGLEIGAEVVNAGLISPTISGNQNNYAPTGLATCSVIAFDVSGATRTITGFDATGMTAGQLIRITALNNDLVLAHQSASSTSGNRISCPGAANLTVRAGGGVFIGFDGVGGAPWRVYAA